MTYVNHDCAFFPPASYREQLRSHRMLRIRVCYLSNMSKYILEATRVDQIHEAKVRATRDTEAIGYTEKHVYVLIRK